MTLKTIIKNYKFITYYFSKVANYKIVSCDKFE